MSDERPDVQQARTSVIRRWRELDWETIPELCGDIDALIAAVRADSEAEIRRLREALEKVERLARTEAGYFTAAEPMSFGDGCKTAYLNIVAQITNTMKSAADTGRPELCGVVGEPESGRKTCELPKGHDGYHQQGGSRWLGYFPKDTGRPER